MQIQIALQRKKVKRMNKTKRLAHRHQMWMQLYRAEKKLREKMEHLASEEEKGSYSLKEHVEENPEQYL